MNNKHSLIIVLAFIFVMSTTAILDLTGKWSGQIQSPNGPLDLIYNFKVDGEKLTGTVDGPTGTVTIDSGVIKNNNLKFKITTPEGYQIPTTGKFYGDSTTLDFSVPDGNVHMKLLRVK
jgi:hypothetical protein